MTSGNNPDSPDKPLTPYRQQRAVPRYAFFGMTELTDSAGSRTLSGKVEEISRKGCYVDTMNVFPEGTSVHVRISHNREAFVTSGEVLYVRERRGMGIAFVGTPNDQLGILDSWLAERASIVAII